MKPKFARKLGILGGVLSVLVLLAATRGAPTTEGVTTAAGPTTFQKTYGGSDHDWANAVAGPLDDGGFLLVGETRSFGAGVVDMYAVRIDSSGNPVWSKTYGGSDWDNAYAVAGPLAGEGFLLVGRTRSFGDWTGWSDMYAVRMDSSGASGCQETNSATQATTPTTWVTAPSTQVTTSTPTVMSPTPQTSVPSTGTNTLCPLAPTPTPMPIPTATPLPLPSPTPTLGDTPMPTPSPTLTPTWRLHLPLVVRED